MGLKPIALDELVDDWTLLDSERALVVGKRGSTRLGFAVMLKIYTRHGRFPAGADELAGEVVEFVGRQVGVPADELVGYAWTGRTIEYHRAQIRRHLGFGSAPSRTRRRFRGGWWRTSRARIRGMTSSARSCLAA